MALVVKDKPLTIARVRDSVIYRLGAVPRGASTGQAIRRCSARLDEDLADVEGIVMDRLARQDQLIAGLRSEAAATRIAMRELAQQLRLGCVAVARAAEIVEQISEMTWRREA